MFILFFKCPMVSLDETLFDLDFSMLVAIEVHCVEKNIFLRNNFFSTEERKT